MRRIALALVILVCAGVGYSAVPSDPSGPRPAVDTLPATPRNCHPVDGDDAHEDRYGDVGPAGGYGGGPEKETLADEGEIQCVSDKKFQVIRWQLGLRGKP